MKLSKDDVALLRSLVEWRRKNGWTREYRLWDTDQHDHTYEHRGSGLSVEATMHRITLFPGEPRVVYEVGVDANGHLLFHGWPWSVRSAVNAIAAAEVIPPEMAPMHRAAFAAGIESLPWHYAVKDRFGDVRNFGEDLEGALNWAAPVGDYPQETVLRWRQGLQETAVIPDELQA